MTMRWIWFPQSSWSARVGTKVAPTIDAAPFRAGDPARPGDERFAALKLAFFAPGQH